jgi:GNAT superfamily N-acetyltransferase
MAVKFACLADRPEALDTIARWYFDEWGHLRPDAGPERIVAKLQGSMNRDRLPLILLAMDDQDVVAAVELKYHEMDIYPEREHWLGGVYVAAEHRGRGVAARLIGHAVAKAAALGVEILHLQTERRDGGIYARLGWLPVERVNYRGVDVLLMQRDIAPGDGLLPH